MLKNKEFRFTTNGTPREAGDTKCTESINLSSGYVSFTPLGVEDQ